jgi:hypothetical protein
LNPGHFGCFTIILVSCGESCLLVSWCAGATWRAVMRIMTGVGDLVQRIENDYTCRILGGRAIERSGGTVCDLHYAHGDKEHRFLGRASKPRSMVCEWFGLKTTWTGFPVWASKLATPVW